MGATIFVVEMLDLLALSGVKRAGTMGLANFPLVDTEALGFSLLALNGVKESASAEVEPVEIEPLGFILLALSPVKRAGTTGVMDLPLVLHILRCCSVIYWLFLVSCCLVRVDESVLGCQFVYCLKTRSPSGIIQSYL